MSYEEMGVSIRDIQLAQLEILIEFDRVCKEKHIPYQLFSGTLLGAIRHKGFIPWDDDIDVCLLREDYERFIAVCHTGILDESFFLQTCFSDPSSVVQFAKLRKNGTVFENNVDCSPKSHTGIYIDIFPMDHIPDNEAELNRWIKRIQFLYALETSSVWERVKNATTLPKRVARCIMHFCVKIISKRRIDLSLQKLLSRYKNYETKYVSHMTNAMSLEHTRQYAQESDSFRNITYVQFEGHDFPAPCNYDAVLTAVFGDYMQLPPKEEQKPHHGIVKVAL